MKRFFFYGLLIVLFLIIAFKQDRKIRKDQYCKESLFLQMIFKKCTPRDFLLNEDLQENI